MELALRLGDSSQPLPAFLAKTPPDLAPPPFTPVPRPLLPASSARESGEAMKERSGDGGSSDSSSFLQLDLLPFSPVPRRCNGGHGASRPADQSSRFRLPWLVEHLGSEPGLFNGRTKHLNVNPFPAAAEDVDDAGAQSSSPNSAASSFAMDFGIVASGRGRVRSEMEVDAERDCSRGSDEDENGSTRKKLRLSKEQSAFLEESFKEHSTLNPKQKIALAKELNLRPRQVEVWFQNRRARTKLKQTEIDCEYLKRCCEILTEENRRLQKELQDLRALKTSRPFYMQSPATTLTMCPSCERSVPATTPSAAAALKPTTHPLGRSQPGQCHNVQGQQQEQHSPGP
ncbi:hypothetical protein MLD38_015951 [Melastoma candidum]|uniref:Uncharacterized protein n=1 Tax=Melastoma candidum TaxID=119954 RepID=A0ACB9RHZ1_9MYRT|nr:hypothetical protein MLD38_015951 [Melastoma candidum]